MSETHTVQGDRRPWAVTRLPAWPRLLGPLLALELGLVAGYLLTSTRVLGEQLALWFDLDREQSVGAWFSSCQLFALAAVLALTRPRPKTIGAPSLWFLRLGALGALFLSMDEAVSVHEALSTIVHHGAPHLLLGWMPLYVAAGVAALACAWGQVLRLWRSHRRCTMLFAAGFAVFVSGGLGLELAGFYGLFAHPQFQVVLEEFAEMAGVTLMLCAALRLRDRLNGA